MEDNQYVKFLQWALPRLNMRWRGFRKVRRQVRKRVEKRIAELKLPNLEAYQEYLEGNTDEWLVLDSFCRITISRFYRDRVVFDYLGSDIFPVLASLFQKEISTIRVWSAGCASGEETYTVAILWHFLISPQFPSLKLEIVASDVDPVMIERGKVACYRLSSLRSLPTEWLVKAFDQRNDEYLLKQHFKEGVTFSHMDIRKEVPDGLFHIVFCRNLAFTYFDTGLQQSVLRMLYDTIASGGVLITGTHERIPFEKNGFKPWVDYLPIYQKT